MNNSKERRDSDHSSNDPGACQYSCIHYFWQPIRLRNDHRLLPPRVFSGKDGGPRSAFSDTTKQQIYFMEMASVIRKTPAAFQGSRSLEYWTLEVGLSIGCRRKCELIVLMAAVYHEVQVCLRPPTSYSFMSFSRNFHVSSGVSWANLFGMFGLPGLLGYQQSDREILENGTMPQDISINLAFGVLFSPQLQSTVCSSLFTHGYSSTSRTRCLYNCSSSTLLHSDRILNSRTLHPGRTFGARC